MQLRLFFPAISMTYGIGNWFSFLALLVYVQTQAGAVASAGLFLAQTVPALLVAGQIARAVPLTYVRTAWVTCQVSLAALTVPAAFLVEHIWTVYLYAGLSMILRAVANPLLMTLVSTSVPSGERPNVLRAVSATSAITLAVAPAIGGALLPVLGPTWLLLLNAALFVLVAVAMLLNRALTLEAQSTPTAARRVSKAADGRWLRLHGFVALVRVEGTEVRTWTHPYTRLWMLLLFAGAILNIIETPLVFDIIQLNETVFGWMLAAYGAGGLLVLLGSLRSGANPTPNRTRLRALFSAAAMAIGFAILSAVALASSARDFASVAAITAFFALGYGASWLSGTARAWLDASGGEDKTTTKAIWTWASQVTLAINLVIYLAFFVLYSAFTIGPWILAPALASYAVLIWVLVRTPPPSERERTEI